MATVVGSNIKAPKKLTLKELSLEAQDNSQSLGDVFPTNLDDNAPVVNLPSSINMAAHAAALSPNGTDPDTMIDSYRQALAEDTLEGQSRTATGLIAQAQSTAMQNNSNDLLDIFANPNLTDQQKEAAAGAVYDAKNAMYSPQNLLSTKALGTPVGSVDNSETDNTRYTMSGVTTDINSTKRAIQQIYSSNMSLHEPNLARKTASFLLSLVPFPVKTYMVAKMAADQSDAPVSAFLKTFVEGSGTSIKDMRDYISSLPIDQQVDAAQRMADIINDHSSILMMPDEGKRREVLQDVLGYQGMNGAQEVAGNISTWLDDIIGVTTLKGVVKGAKLFQAGRSADDMFKDWDFNFSKNYNEAKATQSASKDLVPTGGMTVHEGASAPSAPSGPNIKQLPFNSYEKSPVVRTPEDEVKTATQDSVRSQVQPVSVYENLKDTNPDMARDAFDSMIVDQSGEAAKALSGADRSDALFNALGPEIEHADGSIRNKVLSPDAMAQLRDSVPFDIMDMMAHDGKIQYVQKEKAAARAFKVNQFESAIGFTPRGEMFTIRPDLNNFTYNPHGFAFTGVYGPANNGFSDAFDAIDVAKFALRNTGIDETNLGLLRRVDGNYIPTSLSDIPKLKEKASVWVHATPSTGVVEAEASSSKGFRFDLTDSPVNMNVNLGEGKWLREVVAKDKDTGQEIGKLTYANHDMPPSIEVSPAYQRKGVATAMVKMAKNQGGVLGDDATGQFSNGVKSTRTGEGQAFRAGSNPDSVNVYLKNIPFMDDYLVTVNHDYHITARDVTNSAEVTGGDGWQPMKVKLNFFDRWVPMGGRQGTFSDIILDQASMLDPHIVQSAVQAGDKSIGVEKSMLKMVSDFTDKFRGLRKLEQQRVLDEILEANLARREHDYSQLANQGLSQDAIDSIKSFRRYWDANWVLDNKRYARGLANQGYQEYVHTGTNTSLPARPVSQQSVSGGVNVWNPSTDTLEHVSNVDVKLLYKNGGGIAKLRQPFTLDDDSLAEYVLHRNDPQGGYLKAFSDNSQVLNYIPGYFKISYKDPFHIIEVVKDARGKKLYEHSVATAKDTKSAKLAKNRMQAQNQNYEYYYRQDRGLDTEAKFDDDFGAMQASGRSSFRRRGKLLEDSDSLVTDLSSSHVRNPVETMVTSAVSLSRKIAMQDVIEAMDQRMLWQWKDFFPINEGHQPYIPTDLREIKYRGIGDHNQSDVADARRSAQFSNYLKYGYVNLLDDGIKSIFQNVADLFGKIGLNPAERSLRNVSDLSLTRGFKSVTYYAYLGTAPLRQLLIQANQAVLLGALNPKWVTSPKAFSQPMYIAARTIGIEANHPVAISLAQRAWGDIDTAEKVYQQFHRSGLAAAVDHQNFISGAVNDMAKNMIAASKDTALSAVTKPFHYTAQTLRKVGFDAGEFYNMMMSWLAHRDLAIQKGMNPFRDDVADHIVGAARNYTGNMNFVGDQATNRNALSIIFQYTQNTQKMLLNLTTNRGIPFALKRNLGILSLMLFGTGSSLFFSSKLNSIKNKDAREIVRQGMEGWMFNKMLSLTFGGKSEIDWSGLSPFNAYGALDTIHGIFTTNLGEIIANTPSASLLFGNNPRITKAVKDFARYTHLIDDIQDPTTLLDVANSFAKISSGYSALAKAKYVLELNKKIATSGTITQDNLDKVNAIGVAMGFPTVQDAEKYWVANAVYEKRQQVIDDTTNYYKELKSHYVDKRLTGDELLYVQRLVNEAHRMGFLDTDLGRQTFNRLLERDLKSGDASMYNNILRNCPLFNQGDCQKLIMAAPFENEQDRQDLLDLQKFGEQWKQPDYDEKK